MSGKLTEASVIDEWAKIDEEHNKKHNPSGVPFKGELKRPAEPSGPDENEVANAKVYDADPDGPKSRSEVNPSMILPGTSTGTSCATMGSLTCTPSMIASCLL